MLREGRGEWGVNWGRMAAIEERRAEEEEEEGKAEGDDGISDSDAGEEVDEGRTGEFPLTDVGGSGV